LAGTTPHSDRRGTDRFRSFRGADTSGQALLHRDHAPGRPGQELEQWDEIKLAASEAILALGGTITHHHAVGRDHREWYLREVPPLFTAALGGAKAELDPAGIMNPGVLLQPTGAVT